MRDHDECDDAMNAALAKGKDGYAEFLAVRCDFHHGHIEPPVAPEETPGSPHVDELRAAVAGEVAE